MTKKKSPLFIEIMEHEKDYSPNLKKSIVVVSTFYRRELSLLNKLT